MAWRFPNPQYHVLTKLVTIPMPSLRFIRLLIVINLVQDKKKTLAQKATVLPLIKSIGFN